jgi:hypothetical protein
VVGDLDEPGAGGAPLRIEESSLAKNEEEYFLDQILGFGSIVEDSFRQCLHQVRIASEKESQCLSITRSGSRQQVLIGPFLGTSLWSSSAVRLLHDEWRRLQIL